MDIFHDSVVTDPDRCTGHVIIVVQQNIWNPNLPLSPMIINITIFKKKQLFQG